MKSNYSIMQIDDSRILELEYIYCLAYMLDWCVCECVFCVRFIKRSLHWNVSPFYVGQHDLEIASHSFIYMILYKLAHIQFIRSFVRSFIRSIVSLARSRAHIPCVYKNQLEH